MVREKWRIITNVEEHILFDLHQVSRFENQLRKEGQAYKTIYYRDNNPVRYVLGHGYEVLTKDEEAAVIDEVRPKELLQFANCEEDLSELKSFYRAGNNGTKYCSKQCAYEAYEGFYSREQVNSTLVNIEKR